MGLLGLVLAAFIASVSAGQLKDFHRYLPELSLCGLDENLCNFLKSEESKCEMNPRKREDARRREPYPPYLAIPSSYNEGYALQDSPSTSQPVSERAYTDTGRTEGSELFLSNILDSSTAQPLEESTENVDGASMKPGEVSGDEDVDPFMEEDPHGHGLYSHEYQDTVRSVDG